MKEHVALKADLAALGAVLMGTAVFASVSGPFLQGTLILFVINVILVISYRTIVTMGGWSFAHVAIMAVGAYAVAVLSKDPFGVPVLIAVLFGGVFAALVATLLAWPVLRTRQYYFFLSTFAAGEALRQCLIQLKSVTGGTSGIAFIPRPEGLDASSNLQFLYLSIASAALLGICLTSFDASETGKKIRAVGEDEELSSSLGINAWALRATAFIIGCFGAGIAGGLMASYNGIVSPSDFGPNLMFLVVAACIIGGTTRLAGPLVGLVFLTLIELLFRDFPVYIPLIWGTFVIIAVLYLPDGFEGVFARIFRAKRAPNRA